MAALQDKYKDLISAAQADGIQNLNVQESDGVLHISGEAPSGSVKDKLYEIYNKIDPNYLSGDVVMNVTTAAGAEGTKMKVVTNESALNIRKGPGTDQEVVGQAAHGDEVSMISKTNEQWMLVKTAEGTEGYAYSRYLEQA